MRQLFKTAIPSIPIIVYLLFSFICLPTFGQLKTDKKTYNSKAVKDPFKQEAVTPEEMTKRAKYVPYVAGEIVVAIELNTSKAMAKEQIRQYDWKQLFGDENVEPVSFLMTKELSASKSVSLVHLSLSKNMDVFKAMQTLNGQADVLWSSPNFYYEGDP